MKSLSEMGLVMGSLGKLKTARENLRKINVTDDYTIDERQLTTWTKTLPCILMYD